MMSNERRKMDRKTTEKNRRNEMKCLCSKLVSLIPPLPADHHHFNPQKELLSQQDQIGQAVDYITKLSARIEELKKTKLAQTLSIAGNNNNNNKSRKGSPNTSTSRSELLPVVIRVEELGSSLEVVLISGLHKNFMLHQVIRLLEEEGTEVVNTNLSYIGDKIFHTLHAQVKVARIGVDISRIRGRLEELIY